MRPFWQSTRQGRTSGPPVAGLAGAAAASRVYPLEEQTLIDDNLVPIREVRVAVTMVGGTSLAIYESGVAQELFRMVHGQGIYGLLKRLTHSHAYIDILSGTSAGGINTICLGATLCTGGDLAPLRDVWISYAGIDDLFQDPKDASATALLRGNDYYLGTLEHVFGLLTNPAVNPTWLTGAIPSGWSDPARYAGYSDLDLFVTGTYYEGQPRTFFDLRSRPVFTQDYAGVFALKHRARRQESHFHPDMQDPGSTPLLGTQPRTPERGVALAKRLGRIARTTSSLPAIFEPSEVRADLMNGVIELPRNEEVNYFFDGGFLNHSPIDLVLKEIYRRPADQEVQRRVFFVEPQPEDLRGGSQGKQRLPTALDSYRFYQSVPGHQSLSGALGSIYEHNRRARRLNDLLDTVRRMMNVRVPISPEQQNAWVDVCLHELRDQVVALWEGALGLQGFSRLSHEQQPQEARKEKRAHAEALRGLGAGLYVRMRDRCGDYVKEDPEGAAALAPALSEPRFWLQDVDTSQLGRKIDYALDEVYRTLYPTAESLGVDRLQQQLIRQKCLEALPPGGYEQVKSRLRELQHLRDLAEIVDENLAVTVAAVVGSPEYQDAARLVNTPQEVTTGDRLWNLLVGCLTELLQPIGGGDVSDPELAGVDLESVRSQVVLLRQTLMGSLEGDGVAGVRQQMRDLRRLQSALFQTDQFRLREEIDALSEQMAAVDRKAPERSELRKQLQEWKREQLEVFRREGEQFRERIGDVSRAICAVLGGDPDATAPRREQWANVGSSVATAPPTLVMTELHNRLTDLLHQAAEILSPVLAILLHRGPEADDRTPQRASVPLAWALDTDWQVRDREHIGRALGVLDLYLFPIERAADLESHDQVGLVHITPRDVQVALAQREPAQKLAGDALGNLGGFLKRSWRVNDFLWGRLDGAGAIASTLLESERLVRLLTVDPSVGERLLAAIDAYISDGTLAECPATPAPDDIGALLWESGYERARESIGKWLGRGQQDANWVSDEAAVVDLILFWVLKRHQLEILKAELPEAVAEAISEHGEWQGRSEADQLTIRGPSRQEPGPQRWRPGSTPGPVRLTTPQARGASAAAAGLASLFQMRVDGSTRDAVRADAGNWTRREMFGTASDQPAARLVADYFEQHYAIGEENVTQDIPPLVMLRRVLTGLLIGLHVLGNSLPEGVKRNAIGRLLTTGLLRPLSLVVGGLYGFVTVVAEGRAVAAAAHAVAWTILVAGVALWVMGLAQQQPMIYALMVVAALFELLMSWARHSLLRAGARAVQLAGLGLVLFAVVRASALGSYFSGLALFERTQYVAPTQYWWWGFALVALGWLLEWGASRSWRQAAGAILAQTITFALALALGQHLGDRMATSASADLSSTYPLAGFAQPWTLFAGLLAATVLLGWGLQALSEPLRNPVAPAGMLSLELAGSREPARAIVEHWTAEKLVNRARLSLLVDTLFAVAYSTLLSYTCYLASRNGWSHLWLHAGIVLAFGQWGAGLLDACENVALWALLDGSAQEAWPRAARLFSQGKFSLVLSGLIYMVVGALGWLAGSLLGGNPTP